MSVLAVEAKGLSRRFEEVEALRGLDLEVRQGELFGLVGPDGAGKTTTVRILAGLLAPTSGTVEVLGRDITARSGEVKSDLGYLSQRFTLYGDLTIDENIEFFAEIHLVRDFRRRRDELLEFTRLFPFRKRLADRLSGGMKQKLALACTLIHSPRLLLLDEPTTGVDPVSRRDLWAILSALLRSGITIVLTTPYMDEAERCSRVGLLSEGRLMAVETPRAIKRLMRGTVIEIVCPELRRASAVLKSLPGVREVQLFGDRLNAVVADAPGGLPAIEAALRREGLPALPCRALPPSLENVFMSLTGPGAGEGGRG